jgi:hypothetical protein
MAIPSLEDMFMKKGFSLKKEFSLVFLLVVVIGVTAQTSIKISDLTATTTPGGSDVLPMVQSGATKKITVANLMKYVGWVDDGTVVRLTTATDNVAIGSTNAIFNDDGVTGANIGKWVAIDGGASGNAAYLGIGGTIPGVNDRVGALNFFNYSMGGVDNRTAAIFSFNQGAATRGNLEFYTTPNNTGPLERMEISYTGEVGIGINASTGSNVRLQIAGMGSSSSTYNTVMSNNVGTPMNWFRDDGKVFIGTTDPAGAVAPASNGVFLLGTTGQFSVMANGEVLLRAIRGSQATPPTCSSNCGTSPSVAGSDGVMTVTMGSSGSPASGWVVTFNGTWAAAPACIVQSALTSMVVGKMPIAVQTTTTTMTVTTNGTAPANSDKYSVHCQGTQ